MGNLSETVTMSVSSMTRHGDEKAVYVLFADGEKTAEFIVPGCKLVSSKGFDEPSISQLRDYVDNEQDCIFNIAKNVNPLKAFMGED